MRLTHIKLVGFKSFTDPTTIPVPGQLVAVIGPNGCGKSNVIDAVRWVLGEASAKQLRGESMQDVIFNGAATRRPAPRASVELIFDNSDGSLQGEWGRYGEISIKRQLTRQGESTYFINNQVVRRRDITDLFLGTGVGARGYAVIEQGMISRIIEARPEELRAYIEEAAGVSKYKERRKETESRLKDTREHLQRLSDLQNELSRQVEKLEKQAQTAERYRLFKEQLAQQQDLLDFVQWQNALNTADLATEQHQLFQEKQETVATEHQELSERIHTLREQETQEQSHVHELNKQHALLREQSARLEEQIRSQQNLKQRLEREKLAAQVALQKIDQQQQQLRDEIALLDEEIFIKEQELEEWAIQVAEKEAILPELEEAQNTVHSSFQNQQDELNRIKRELALKQQQLQHTQHNQQHNQERLCRLQQELAALNLPSTQELTLAQQEAEQLQIEQEHYETLLNTSEAQQEQLKQQLHTANEQYQTLQTQQLTLQAQQEALASLLKQTPNTQAFWQDTPYAEQSELWQSIQLPQEWQHALSIILAHRLHAKAVAPDFTPNATDEHSAAWFQRDIIHHKKTLPVQAFIHQIQTQPVFEAILHHWLDGALCSPNLQHALQHQHELHAHQFWITPEGHQVDKWSVTLHGKQEKQHLIEHKNRYEHISTQLHELAPQIQQAKQRKEAAEQALSQQEQNSKNHLAQQRQHAGRLQAAQNLATELLAKINQGQLRRNHIEQECEQLEAQNRQHQFLADGMEHDIFALQESIEQLTQQHQHISEQRHQQQHQLKQAQLALLEANRQYGLNEVALHKIQQRKNSIQEQIQHLQTQTLDWQERQTELALAEENDQGNEEQRLQLETLGEQIFQLDESIHLAQNRLQETQEQGRTLFSQQQSLAAQLPQLQAATQTALLQQQEALINAKRFHDNLLNRQADVEALKQLAPPSLDLNGLNQEIHALAQKIQNLGAVNLVALQELEEARERDEYYRQQSLDVQQAIDLLEEAISQIDKETKSRFKDTFDAVNEKVQTFFPTLFGGGEATLHMVGDDLLTSGVSIMARPPGKKNSTIHLLSGGEKALTAMSLVFALFSLNPAPFCLLDEVDAPLDDANTTRFCHLVKEMSAQTQFLYISHNRITMEMAEQLIGVTMQEKGVSRIVAVDIQQALKMAEPHA